MKWTMHDSKHFTCQHGDCTIYLRLGGFYPMWDLIRGGIIIDSAQYHRPVTTKFNAELAAKAACEKVLLNNEPNPERSVATDDAQRAER